MWNGGQIFWKDGQIFVMHIAHANLEQSPIQQKEYQQIRIVLVLISSDFLHN